MNVRLYDKLQQDENCIYTTTTFNDKEEHEGNRRGGICRRFKNHKLFPHIVHMRMASCFHTWMSLFTYDTMADLCMTFWDSIIGSLPLVDRQTVKSNMYIANPVDSYT